MDFFIHTIRIILPTKTILKVKKIDFFRQRKRFGKFKQIDFFIHTIRIILPMEMILKVKK